MPSNRPNKQKRQRQNRLEREARRARSVHAGEATAISRGEREAAAPTTSARAGGTGKGGKAKGSAAPTSARAQRAARYTVPGQRAVVMAFLFTLVSAVTLLVFTVPIQREVPADDPVLEDIDEDDQEVTDEGTVTYIDDGKLVDEEEPAVVAGVLLTPILITGTALWFTKRPQRSMAWTMAMIALAGYVFFIAGASYGTMALPAMIALAVGGFQSRRAEGKERMAARRAARDAEGDGEVIDVDAVEDAGRPDDDDGDASDHAAGDEDRR